jgi:hypothetical protein
VVLSAVSFMVPSMVFFMVLCMVPFTVPIMVPRLWVPMLHYSSPFPYAPFLLVSLWSHC